MKIETPMKKLLITPKAFIKNPLLMNEAFELSKLFNFEIVLYENNKNTFEDAVKSLKSEIILIGLEKLTSVVIKENPQLKFVSKFGVGLDNIDLLALEKNNVKLGWTAGINKRSVSELVLAFALGYSRNVIRSIDLMQRGIWEKNGGNLLSSKKFGIVGLGHIGTDLASLLKPFGCEIIYNDIEDKTQIAKSLQIKYMPYYELLAYCDIISFHVPSNSLTQKMYSEDAIKLTNRRALIINTSRGDIGDFTAIVNAVQSNSILGYASDVFPTEPYNTSNLSINDNLFFTPHIGGNAEESVLAMGRSALEHIKNYLISYHS